MAGEPIFIHAKQNRDFQTLAKQKPDAAASFDGFVAAFTHIKNERNLARRKLIALTQTAKAFARQLSPLDPSDFGFWYWHRMFPTLMSCGWLLRGFHRPAH
jgi:hypothetical protein